LAGRLLALFNVDIGPPRVAPNAVLIQVVVGLAVPLLAALAPVIGGARITAHQAISSYGLGAGFGSSWLDRLIGAIRRLPRPLALSLRNTFRRKGRITLTLITLILGGAMFIGVMSVGTSLNNTLEVLLGDFGFDVLVGFERGYRIERLVQVTQGVPGVTRAEVWDQRPAQLKLSGGEDREVFLWGVPPDSRMFNPRIVSGRALAPGDKRAILLNSKIAVDENIQVGDVITLTINGKESSWDVVGLILNVNNLQRDNFVPDDALAREFSSLNRGGLVMLTAEQHDAKSLQNLIRDLRAAYDAAHLEAEQFQSTADVRQQNQTQFNIITYLMLVMAVLAAVVGSIGLMSTMSINVVERSREIGVMRSIGGTSAALLGIFLFEGVLVGVLSWLIAVPLSYPGARLFSDMVGKAFNLPLDFDYSMPGVVTWFVIVVVLSALASLWPALRATRVSVREALSYE
jgi:putative ABC transport system permease protein